MELAVYAWPDEAAAAADGALEVVPDVGLVPGPGWRRFDSPVVLVAAVMAEPEPSTEPVDVDDPATEPQPVMVSPPVLSDPYAMIRDEPLAELEARRVFPASPIQRSGTQSPQLDSEQQGQEE